MKMLVMVLALVAPAAFAAGPRPARAPEWLAGYWLSCDGGQQTVEAWIGYGSGALVGVNQSAGFFEHLRIEPVDGAIVYIASPGGASPTAFALISEGDFAVGFENAAHDFPQRVFYERNGALLRTRIDGNVDGKAQRAEWRFRAAPLGAQCD
jgi:hypothetical protein